MDDNKELKDKETVQLNKDETKVEDAKVEEANQSDIKPAKQKMEKKNKIMIATIVGLVVIIIALIAVIAGKSKSDKNSDETEATTEIATSSDASTQTSATTEDTATTEKPNDQKQDSAVTAKISNEWESNGKYFGQLDLSISNTSSSEMKDWKIEIDVPAGAAIDSSWNCNCEIKDGKLVVTALDYNQVVAANGKIGDVGIIISVSSKADLAKLTEAPKLYVGGELYSSNNTSSNNSSDNSSTEATTEVSNNNDNNNNNNTTSTEQPSAPPTTESGTPYANHGKLSVKGVDIVDASGNKYQLKGVSTHGIAWFPEYVNEDAFRTLRDDWGANLVRIAMYTDENGGYCSGGNKENLKALVDKGVQAATNLGMYVIIDWHILHDLNPQVNKEEAKKFFEEMSAKYKNNGNVIYEICNEPNGGTGWSDIKSYAEEVIPIIKANSPDAIIIVGTPNWSQDVDAAAANPITGYSNIMYAVHFYAATHTDWLRSKVSSALSSGLPIFVSEFSICDASGNGAIDYNQAEAWMDFINKNNMSYASWSLSNKNETSALISSSCSKTSGWTDSDLSDAGKWLKKTIKGN